MFRLFSKSSNEKKYSLVISGGGARGFYALGILKGLEELGMDKKIDAVYGVSAGGIIASYRGAGYKADEIFGLFSDFGLTSSFNFLPKRSLFKHDKLREKFEKELPEYFEDLKKKIYLGCADTNKAEYILFEKGDLIKPLLGTMSIPGVFLPVECGIFSLMDGGLINNFPVDIAKKNSPENEIIGIYLNYFEENQKINKISDSLSVAAEILGKAQALRNFNLVDHLFYRELSIGVLELNKKKIKSIFDMGYKDCLVHFKK